MLCKKWRIEKMVDRCLDEEMMMNSWYDDDESLADDDEHQECR